MRSSKAIHVVSCHAAGEVGDVIVGGVAPPPGETLWQQRDWIAKDQTLRNFLLNEPRGGVFRHRNLLVPPKHPDADMGFIIMEPADTPPMSGSNSICVATVLLETGILSMTEPLTHLTLEAPGGLVPIEAQCDKGKVTEVRVRNLTSFAHRLSVPLEVEGIPTLSVDTAFGGDSFVIVDRDALGFSHHPSEAKEMAAMGVRLSDAATEQLGFNHPTLTDWKHISFCHFAGPIVRNGTQLQTTSAVAIRPGKIDRSPTGTALSARMAVLSARGQMGQGDRLVARSLIGSEFQGRILGQARIGDVDGILPEISGQAWITGTHQYLLDPDDPWPEGYRLSDTWPLDDL